MADEMLVVASKVRAHLKEQGAMMSGDLPQALNAKLKSLLDEAAKRAKANKRSTVKDQDV